MALTNNKTDCIIATFDHMSVTSDNKKEFVKEVFLFLIRNIGFKSEDEFYLLKVYKRVAFYLLLL